MHSSNRSMVKIQLLFSNLFRAVCALTFKFKRKRIHLFWSVCNLSPEFQLRYQVKHSQMRLNHCVTQKPVKRLRQKISYISYEIYNCVVLFNMYCAKSNFETPFFIQVFCSTKQYTSFLVFLKMNVKFVIGKLIRDILKLIFELLLGFFELVK